MNLLKQVRSALRENYGILKKGVIYSSDNGRLICCCCAGRCASETGRDISGKKVVALGAEAGVKYFEDFGEPLMCESGCTVYDRPAPRRARELALYEERFHQRGPGFGAVKGMTKSGNEKMFTVYGAWRSACRTAPGFIKFDGNDEDSVVNALFIKPPSRPQTVAKWDGAVGSGTLVSGGLASATEIVLGRDRKRDPATKQYWAQHGNPLKFN